MSASGYDDGGDLVYSQEWERRFTSLRSLMGITGQYTVDYASRSGGRQRALLFFDAPLPFGARYDVAALPVGGDAALPRFDATRRGTSVAPHVARRVSLGDFLVVLESGALLHANAANHIVRSLFPTVYGAPPPARADAYVAATLAGADGVSPIDVAHPLANTCEIAELRAAIEHAGCISWLTLDTPRAFFQAALTFFYPVELRRIYDAYRAKSRWLDVLARGWARARLRRVVAHRVVAHRALAGAVSSSSSTSC